MLKSRAKIVKRKIPKKIFLRIPRPGSIFEVTCLLKIEIGEKGIPNSIHLFLSGIWLFFQILKE
jgi:hypothetical protein